VYSARHLFIGQGVARTSLVVLNPTRAKRSAAGATIRLRVRSPRPRIVADRLRCTVGSRVDVLRDCIGRSRAAVAPFSLGVAQMRPRCD